MSVQIARQRPGIKKVLTPSTLTALYKALANLMEIRPVISYLMKTTLDIIILLIRNFVVHQALKQPLSIGLEESDFMTKSITSISSLFTFKKKMLQFLSIKS